MNKTTERITLFYIAPILLAISLYVAYNIYKQRKMKENPSYVEGVILGTASSSKMGSSIKYQFIVDNKLYKSLSIKKSKDIFNVGDSCLVIYDKNDISVNDLYRDELGYLSLISKKGSTKESWNLYLDSLLLEHE